MLAQVEPKLQPLLDGVLNNRNEWQALADSREKELAELAKQAEAGETKPAEPSQQQTPGEYHSLSFG